MNDIFERCRNIGMLLEQSQEQEARDELIKLLDYINKNDIEYSPLVNHLIRMSGLYPYIHTDTSNWDDRFIFEAFKANVGSEEVTLHREQSNILKDLLKGKDLAISAPTSFGKSFIIDAFIAIKRPKNVVIIVPTIALTDETRRRLYKKFANEYQIISTSDAELDEKNIFIFPQERAISYLGKLKAIDMLIIDEFYKASAKYDKDRSPVLLKVILELGKIANQRYYLAPNISTIKESLFTKGMEFRQIDFNTVFLQKHNFYEEIDGNPEIKNEKLLNILNNATNKSLIYAGTYAEIDNVTTLLNEKLAVQNSVLLEKFSEWLAHNYETNWRLNNLVRRGIGIHNGRLHRSLAQIQVRLFEELEGLKNIVSTSSIIEGVNTSAENVIIWKNKDGRLKLNDLTYKNIIGRSGRMFRHFVGNVYILDEPPKVENTNLELGIPEIIMAEIDQDNADLTNEQVAQIIQKKQEISEVLGVESYNDFLKEVPVQSVNSELVKKIVLDLKKEPGSWRGLNFLNSDNPEDWGRLLYKVICLEPQVWGDTYSKIISFTKILVNNWHKSIPELLNDMSELDIGIDKFFELERVVTFNLSRLLNDVNVLYRRFIATDVDISPFIAKVSNAFLPQSVYQLEEYGLPRMISRKIEQAGLFNFTNNALSLHETIESLKGIGFEQIIRKTEGLEDFDKYILKYFFEGV